MTSLIHYISSSIFKYLRLNCCKAPGSIVQGAEVRPDVPPKGLLSEPGILAAFAYGLNLWQPNARAWLIRLIFEDKRAQQKLAQEMVEIAKTDASSSVRLAIASALQNVPGEYRWGVLEALPATPKTPPTTTCR